MDDIRGGSQFRDVDITFPDLGEYRGKMVLNEGTECSDSACFFVNIFPDITADFSFEYDTCVAGDVMFTNESSSGAVGGVTQSEWAFGDGGSSDFVDPMYRYDVPGVKPVTLVVTDDNGCSDTVTKEVDYFPVPQLIVVQPTSFVGCLPASIFFDNLSSPIDSSYDVIWDFGDGNMVNEISPTHEYTDAGNFSVSVDITSPLGCEVDTTFNGLIQILESPTADFSFSPEEPNNFTDEVIFTDLSIDTDTWQWAFGDVATSMLQNPTYAFPDTGVYEVVLTVFHPVTNCPDTISKIVDVRPLATLFMPNAFTPNNDGKNDVFKGKGFLDGISNYQLNIFNRWGQLIFEATDPNEGWNGQVDNSGALSPLGVYVYRASYIGPRGEERILEGHVTLIR